MADPIRVLCVDDDPAFAEMTATFLEREAGSVDVAVETDPDGVLSYLEEGDVDCVVSDYDMPGMDGLELLGAVRERYPDLPFILFTGKGSEEIASEAISAGVTDYLQKGGGSARYELLSTRIENAVARYRTRQRIEAQRTQYQRLFEQAPVMYAVTRNSENGPVIEDCNGRFLDRLGYDREEVIGRPLSAFYTEESTSALLQEGGYDRALAGEFTTEERGFVTADGEVVETLLRAAPRLDEDGEVVGTLTLYTDVTEQRKRDQELERYRAIVEASGDPVYALDLDGRHTFVNDAHAEMVGYTAEETLGEHVSMIMDEEEIDAGEERIRELIANDERDRATFETELVTADGERIPCENHLALLTSEDGEVYGTCGIVRDISERAKRERRLEALHEATRELMAAATREEVAALTANAAADTLDYPDNVVRLIDEDGNRLLPVAVTDSGRVDLGERPVYQVGEAPAGRAYERGETIIHENAQEIDDGYDRGNARAVMYLPIGEYGVLVVANPTIEAFEEADVRLAEIFVANVEAAFERVEHERALARQNERLERFAHIVSHDLRNPLNVAEGHLELLREECESDHITPIERAHDRMNSLIEDVLTLARAGQLIDDPEPVALSRAIEECWRTIPAGNAELSMDVDPTVEADRDRLRQLFENLFRNAIEHGGEDVTVRVGPLESGFFVEDDGPGIPEEEREEAFDPGYSTTDDGIGLGLSIVAEIAEAHGWRVRIAEGSDGGARFEFTGVESA